MSCLDCALDKRCDGVNEVDCDTIPDALACAAGLVIRCFPGFKLSSGVCISCDVDKFCDGVNQLECSMADPDAA